MVDQGVQDLLGLDRDVARAATALARWRTLLGSDPEEAAANDPFDELRRVAAKSTWDALGALQPSVADVPLREALRRWVMALVQARVGAPDALAWAREAASPKGHYQGPQPRVVSWREAWRGVALAKSAAEVPCWLEAAVELAPSLASLQRRRAARRIEVARRMGLAHPWDQLVPVGREPLRAAASRLLDRTDELSSAIWRESLEGESTVAGVLHGAVAREAGDGWPARLTPRWLDETFGSCAKGFTIVLPELPQTTGAASFARALAMFGFAVRVGSADGSMPYALARDPGFAAAHAAGSVFGALAADAEFQVRVLGIGRRSADVQARVLARTALFEARLTAARIVLGDDLLPGRDVFEDVTARLFGAPLDARFHGAWPVAAADAPARWLGLLQAPGLRRTLRETFDTDWFRNPRAWRELRSIGAVPAHAAVGEDAVEAGGDALVRFFEDALG